MKEFLLAHSQTTVSMSCSFLAKLRSFQPLQLGSSTTVSKKTSCISAKNSFYSLRMNVKTISPGRNLTQYSTHSFQFVSTRVETMYWQFILEYQRRKISSGLTKKMLSLKNSLLRQVDCVLMMKIFSMLRLRKSPPCGQSTHSVTIKTITYSSTKTYNNPNNNNSRRNKQHLNSGLRQAAPSNSQAPGVPILSSGNFHTVLVQSRSSAPNTSQKPEMARNRECTPINFTFLNFLARIYLIEQYVGNLAQSMSKEAISLRGMCKLVAKTFQTIYRKVCV